MTRFECHLNSLISDLQLKKVLGILVHLKLCALKREKVEEG